MNNTVLAWVVVLLMGTTLALPVRPKREVTVVQNFYTRDSKGQYEFKYELSDGTYRSEKGTLENGYLVVRGFFSYMDEEGVVHATNFVADRNGYQPDTLF